MEPVQMMLETLRAFLGEVGHFLPKLLLALAIAFGGWLAAKAARFAVVRGLRSINFHVLTERARVDAVLQMGGSTTDTTALIGALAYWFVIVAALVMAFNGLGLTYVTELLAKVALFVPRLILAVVIVTLGAYFAQFLDATVAAYGRNAGIDEAAVLGRLARYAVLLFMILIALDQLQVAGDIIRQTFLIVLSGVVFALALAFGLGGRDWAARLLERWRPQRGDSGGAAAPPPGKDET